MCGIAFILAHLVLPLTQPSPSSELLNAGPDTGPAVTGADIARIMRHQVGLDRSGVPRLPGNVIHWCPRCVLFAPKPSESLIPAEPDLFQGLP